MNFVNDVMKAIYTYKFHNINSPKELHLGYETWSMIMNEVGYGMLSFKQSNEKEDHFAGLKVIIDKHCKYKIDVK